MLGGLIAPMQGIEDKEHPRGVTGRRVVLPGKERRDDIHRPESNEDARRDTQPRRNSSEQRRVRSAIATSIDERDDPHLTSYQDGDPNQ